MILFLKMCVRNYLTKEHSFTSLFWILLGHEWKGAILSICEFLQAQFLFSWTNTLWAHLLAEINHLYSAWIGAKIRVVLSSWFYSPESSPDLIKVIFVILGNEDNIVDHISAWLAMWSHSINFFFGKEFWVLSWNYFELWVRYTPILDMRCPRSGRHLAKIWFRPAIR